MHSTNFGFLPAALLALTAILARPAAAEVTYAAEYTCNDEAAASLSDAKALGDEQLYADRFSQAVAAGQCSVVAPYSGAPKPTYVRSADRRANEARFPPSWLFRPRR